MDKITTPMAVLISGILIFMGLYLNYSKPTYQIFSFDNNKLYERINVDTGKACTKYSSTNPKYTDSGKFSDEFWKCKTYEEYMDE